MVRLSPEGRLKFYKNFSRTVRLVIGHRAVEGPGVAIWVNTNFLALARKSANDRGVSRRGMAHIDSAGFAGAFC
jgi:hypothetical protein